MNLVRASRIIETQRAIRNTALKKAPRISARCHWRGGLVSRDFDPAQRCTHTICVLDRGCLLRDGDSPEPNGQGDDVVQLRASVSFGPECRREERGGRTM